MLTDLHRGRPERPPAALGAPARAAERRHRTLRGPLWALGLALGILTVATAIVAAGAALAGCRPAAAGAGGSNDPLGSLPSAELSTRYDLAYWVGQESTGTLVWRQALAFCRSRPRLPNCRTVRMASWWGTPPRTPS